MIERDDRSQRQAALVIWIEGSCGSCQLSEDGPWRDDYIMSWHHVCDLLLGTLQGSKDTEKDGIKLSTIPRVRDFQKMQCN